MKQYIAIICGLLLPLTIFSQHTISGQVVLPNATGVCDVLVTLRDAGGQTLDQEVTPTSGLFSFENLTDGADYTLHFSKDDIAINGASTFDLVLIARHILGISSLSQYGIWAADVNNSSTVTTLDMIQERRVILGIQQTFPGVEWAFGEADETFPGGQIDVPNLNADIDLDVIGVKRGDVNDSAVICD